MFSEDNSDFYDEIYNNMEMKPTTSASMHPRLSMDSGVCLSNDSIFSSDLNESQLMDISAATASDASFSFQSGPLEISPSSKWARIRTPPNRKKPAEEDHAMPAGFNFFSPPSQKRMKTMFTPPQSSMKTPESLRKSIRISSPSPFKVTFSKTPLKLSNSENVTGFHIGRSGAYYNKKVTGSASKRCLLTARPDGFTILGSPKKSDVLDFSLNRPLEDLGFLPRDSSPEVNSLFDLGEEPMDYHQYSGLIERTAPFQPLPRPPSNTENGETKSVSFTRKISRNLLKETKESSSAVVTHHPLSIKQEIMEDPEMLEEIEKAKKQNEPKKEMTLSQIEKKKNKLSLKEDVLKQAKEKEMKEWKTTPFETPKKEVPLYSGRWLVISTGRTLAQEELFADAKRFFRTHRATTPATAPRPVPRRHLPTIARVTLFKHRYQYLRAL